MVGKPIPPKPGQPQSPSPGVVPSSANPLSSPPGSPAPMGVVRASSEPTATVPSNRNAPSSSAAAAAASADQGGKPPRVKRRSEPAPAHGSTRLVSLDAFRGFIMMMLAASGFGILAFSRIDEASTVWKLHERSLWQDIGFHFDHPAWRSSYDIFKVSFWDLIQPAFMFMVGAAMPFSNARRQFQGQGTVSRTLHAMIRSVVLALLGVFLYSMGHERTNWIFPNVLCQIGLGYFFAWLLHHLRPAFQLTALALILVGYWGWFRMSPPPANYDYGAVKASEEKGEVFADKFAPWSKNANAAFFFDEWLLPKLRSTPETPPASDLKAEISALRQWQPAGLSVQKSTSATNTAGTAAEKANADASTGTDESSTESASPETPPDNAEATATGEAPPTEASPVTEPQAQAPTDAPPGTPPNDAPSTGSDSASGSDAASDEPVTEAEPTKPNWFRQWFLSNTEPHTFNSGGYTTLNFIPSIGTTLLGILCGQLLIRPDKSKWNKLGMLLIAAAVCLGLGILADQTICPVVKRIWTPSWVLFSGGYVIAMLAMFYLVFDIAPLRYLAFPLVVVGMNSILIYMLGQTISGWVRDNVVKVHLSGMIENVFGPRAMDPLWYGPITMPTTVFLLYWLFLLWLYRQRVFLRL